jgi:hypothetical protein
MCEIPRGLADGLGIFLAFAGLGLTFAGIGFAARWLR